MFSIITYIFLSLFSVTYSTLFWSFTGTKLGVAFRGFVSVTGFFIALAGPLSPHYLSMAWSHLGNPSVFSARWLSTFSAAFVVRASSWARNRPFFQWLVGLLAVRLVGALMLLLASLAGIGSAVLFGVLLAGFITGGYILFLVYLPVLAFIFISCLVSLPDLVITVITGVPTDRFARSTIPLFAHLGRSFKSILLSLHDFSLALSTLGTSFGKLVLDTAYITSFYYCRLFEANWFTGVSGPGALTLRTFLSVEIFHILIFPAFSFTSIALYCVNLLLGVLLVLGPFLHAFGLGVWQDPVFEAKVRVVAAGLHLSWPYYLYMRAKLEMARLAHIAAPLFNAQAPWAPYKAAFIASFMMVAPLYILYDLFSTLSIFVTRMVRFGFDMPRRILLACTLTLVVWVLPDMPFVLAEVILGEVWEGCRLLWEARDGTPGIIKELLMALPFAAALGFDVNAEIIKGVDALAPPEKGSSKQDQLAFDRLSTLYVAKVVNLTRRVVLRFMSRLDSVKLPEFISAQYKAPTVESLRSTYSLLADVGLPTTQGFVDSLDPGGDPTGNPYLMEFADLRSRILAQTNFRLGFRDPKVAQHPWVKWLDESLTSLQAPYISTMTFTGVKEELASTARYFTDYTGLETLAEMPDLDDLLDGAWKGVARQFDKSRLTSLADIFKQWYKHPKYSFGFGIGTVKASGKIVQSTREQVVSKVGGKWKFIELMETIFYHGSGLTSFPANVFTKDETLKPSKAEERKVRTIVGIAFPHYIRQLVTNFWPDHNYHPFQVPGKVGMAINGANFSRLAAMLVRHEKVWAGDMTAFDSTQGGVVVRVIAAIRKAGYDRHRDYDKICELIDITYEGLLRQPLGFKNFGAVLSKDRGFTTGHGSTSADNTLALLVNYLFAWRQVTGLRSREFYYYNTLVNLGDDHVLGYDEVFGWTPQRAAEAMKNLGTVMRDEAPGYNAIPVPGMRDPTGDFRNSPLKFLSKVWLPKDGQVLAELESAGLDKIRYPSCHDRKRLVGKMTALMNVRKSTDSMKSYLAILSYIDLTSHHPEIYDILARAAQTYYDSQAAKWEIHGYDLKKVRKIPSYNNVLRRWYNETEDILEDLDAPAKDNESDNSIILLTHDDAFAFFVRWMADFPTLLSPRYASTRWADWLQGKLPARLSWPLGLVGRANNVGLDPTVIGWYLNRTPYQFLRSPALVPQDIPFGVLLMRHWAFMTISRLWSRSRSLSLFDLLRVFDNFISNLVFMLTGSLSTIVIDLDLHFLETLTVLACSYIDFGFPIDPLLYNVPTLSLFLARLISKSLRGIFPSGAVDLQPFDALCGRLAVTKGHTVLVSAPTGTSKSTRMMERLASVAQVPVIVIEPRHLVCVGVGQYMQSLFPNSGIGIQTEGHTAQPGDRLIYTTVQSFLMSTSLQNSTNIFVLDEAHINEPHYNVIRNWFVANKVSVMHLTATPPDGLKVDEELAVPAVNSFSVISSRRKLPRWQDYIRTTRTFLGNIPYGTKVLIFVPSSVMAAQVAAGHQVCFLSSKHRQVDLSKNIFISTSVADAGLTIPDVDVVWTADIDIHVRLTEDDMNPLGKAWDPITQYEKTKPLIGYHKLSAQTIRQRQGRTGRTCDGLFFLIELEHEVVSDLEYTMPDYWAGLSPAAERAVPYFPKEILERMSDQDKAAARIWDLAPSNTWTNYMNLARRWEKLDAPRPPFRKFLDVIEGIILARAPSYNPEEEPELLRKKGPPVLPLDPGLEHPKAPGQASTLHPPWHERPSARQDVPGTGLLCGVHAARGIIRSATYLAPSFDLVHTQLMAAALESPVQDEWNGEAFYSWDVMVRVLTDLYHIKVILRRDGVQMPLFGPNQDLPGLPRAVYLDGAHYNYDGVPILDSDPDDDDQVYAWLEANPSLSSAS